MFEKITCPYCGDTFDPYEGYKADPWFKNKVDAIAEMEDMEPRKVISTGGYQMPIPDEILGMVE